MDADIVAAAINKGLSAGGKACGEQYDQHAA